jgi:phosphoribosylamine--glycine ligase
VRFGDPETQVLMLRLKSDLLPALLAVAEGKLSGFTLDWHDDAALCVVMAAKGYPGTYAKGSEIRGLDDAGADPKVEIFHAGTKRDRATRDRVRILADGGRVLGVTSRGSTIAEARARAYAAVDKIDWPSFCQRDIGRRAAASPGGDTSGSPAPIARSCAISYRVQIPRQVAWGEARMRGWRHFVWAAICGFAGSIVLLSVSSC